MNIIKSEDKIRFMNEAVAEAMKAEALGEVPVGAVIVKDGKIIARAHNLVETLLDSSAHAEMLVIKEAEMELGYKWLNGCSMFVTLEPCSMCAGAAVLARLDEIYMGTDDIKNGACGSVFNIVDSSKLNHKVMIERNISNNICSSMLKEFFRKRRKNKA